MGILGTPNEILLLIAENLPIKDLSHFLSTCRRLSSLLTLRLHNLGVQDIGRLTALQWAAEHGHASLAELAISRGADVGGPGEKPGLNPSPLYLAVSCNHPAVIRILIEHGAWMNAGECRSWVTPLEVAATRGAAEATRELLELGTADTVCFGRPAEFAASMGSVGCIKALVDAGFSLKSRSYRDKTILHHAAEGTTEMVEYLLGHEEVKMAINTPDYSGKTPLHLAVSGSGSRSVLKSDLRLDIVRLLLRHGADMQVKDERGETPVHRAASEGALGCLMAFRDAGFDLNTRGSNGRTVLHNAQIIFYAEEVVEFLLEQMGAGGYHQHPGF